MKLIKKYKEMETIDKTMFAHHIIKNISTNFMKLYNNSNASYDFASYTKIFPLNGEEYEGLFKSIKEAKRLGLPIVNLDKKVKNFLDDFKTQFDEYFK